MNAWQDLLLRVCGPSDKEAIVRGQASDPCSAIARAKLEWECVADALPQLVCLLDGDGRVVRANRVIERWGLGRVNEVSGRDMHEVLHAQCARPGCELCVRLNQACSQVQHGQAQEFQIEDPLLERTLCVDLRPLPRSVGLEKTLAVLLVADVTALHRARMQLQLLNANLESHVQERTQELEAANRELHSAVARREAAEEALRASRDELALLSQELMRAQEAERKRIARELHDCVGQSLSAVKYTLERAVALLRQWKLDDPEPVMLRAIQAVQGTIKEIRLIAMDLRPPVLDDLGAASAVAWFCREFSEAYPGIGTDVQLRLRDADVPSRLGTAVFRSLQELLNNVAKHSKARVVRVALYRDAASLTLEVADDGVGLPDPHDSLSMRHGHGLSNLRERAEMTQGQLSLSAPAGGGTLARIHWRLALDEMGSGDTR